MRNSVYQPLHFYISLTSYFEERGIWNIQATMNSFDAKESRDSSNKTKSLRHI